ncbi:MAG: hydroxyacylglutathione hydrolase [Pseudomonadota bacterium]|nr:hydroxyacylglutathione hydrolase [Pseudomonadota bacterium]
MDIFPIPALKDNYIWAIHAVGAVVVVDPGDAQPVQDEIDRRDLRLVGILVTHHHWDHVNGIPDLLIRHQVPVYGPASETIPERTVAMRDGDTFQIAALGLEMRALMVPGHTAGAIAYHGHGWLLSGDTLFTAGCGRLFEGTAVQMYDSLTTLAALDPATRVYCGHEYTLRNLAFARLVEPGNAALGRRLAFAESQCALGAPTVPAALATETETNPFLRCHVPEVREAAERHAGRRLASPVEVFGVLRAWKDTL